MDIFVMVRRNTTTIFASAKDQSLVSEIKKIVAGIMKVEPDNQQLWKDGVLMEDDKSLAEYGLTPDTAKAQDPATVGLCCKKENGEFEKVHIEPLTVPPELPDVMKPQEPIVEQIAA